MDFETELTINTTKKRGVAVVFFLLFIGFYGTVSFILDLVSLARWTLS